MIFARDVVDFLGVKCRNAPCFKKSWDELQWTSPSTVDVNCVGSLKEWPLIALQRSSHSGEGHFTPKKSRTPLAKILLFLRKIHQKSV